MFLRPKTKLLLSVGIVVTIAVAAIFTVNEDSPKPFLTTPGTAAMRAAINPETGELVTGPDAFQLSTQAKENNIDAVENMLSRSAEGLTEVHYPDGRVGVHLQGRFMSASVARIGDDGKVETLCTEDMNAAADFMSATEPETDNNGLEVR